MPPTYTPWIGTCPETGKRQYKGKQEAKLSARRQRGNGRLSAYHCASCGHWHLGHLRKGIVQGSYTRDGVRVLTSE